MSYRYLFFVFMVTAVCAATMLRAEEHGHGKEGCEKEKDAHDGHSDEKGVIHLNAKQMKMVELELQLVSSGKLAKTLECPGEILVNEDNVAHITPRVPGVTVQVLKTIGDKVIDGELLAILESPELGSAKIDYFTARLNLDLARLDLEREQMVHDNTRKLLDILISKPEPDEIEKRLQGLSIGENKSRLLTSYSALRLGRSAWNRAQKLQADKIISQAEYEFATKQFECAEAEYKGAFEEVNFNYRQRLVQAQRALRVMEITFQNSERRLHILGVAEAQLSAISKENDEQVARYELRAPFAGIVTEKHITRGEHLETTSNCFTIVDLSSVWCNVRVYPKDINRVKVGQVVRIKVSEDDNLLQGKVAVIHPIVSEKTRAAFVRISLDNANGYLRPGLFVTGVIVLEEHEAPVVVPIGAIQTFEGKEIVFVTGDVEGEFKTQPVQCGYSDGIMIEIKSGLEAGQKIVVRNSFILKAELSKGEGGCAH
ncbi:MAG: efflux RND transporter periplasmic adaptor subunit [Planctomycetota bacterium]